MDQFVYFIFKYTLMPQLPLFMIEIVPNSMYALLKLLIRTIISSTSVAPPLFLYVAFSEDSKLPCTPNIIFAASYPAALSFKCILSAPSAHL